MRIMKNFELLLPVQVLAEALVVESRFDLIVLEPRRRKARRKARHKVVAGERALDVAEFVVVLAILGPEEPDL